MDPIQQIVEYFLRLKTKLKYRRKLVTVLAAVVVFAVAYALTLPAITLDKNVAQQQDGLSLEQTDEGNSNQSGDWQEGAVGDEASSDEGSASQGQSLGGPDGSSADNQQSGESAEGSNQTASDASADANDDASSSSQEASEDVPARTDTVIGEPAQEDSGDDGESEAKPAEAKVSESQDQQGSGIQLQSEEIESDKDEDKDAYQEYRRKALGELQEEDKDVKDLGSARFFKVSFKGEDGSAVEPQGDVEVNVEFDQPMEVSDGEELKVVKLTDSDVTVLDDDDVEQNLTEGHTSKVSFKAHEAAVYGVVKATKQESVGQDTQRTITAENNSYKVTLTYDEASGLPEKAHLRIEDVTENSDDYNNVKSAVVSAKKSEDSSFDENSLGMAALDISILDGNEQEVEPTGKVQVEIEAKNLPDEAQASGIEVQHIVQNESQDQDSQEQVAQTVASGVEVNGESAAAQFEVEGFSVFTITWTKGSGNTTRIGNVNLHYVDVNGLEITRTTAINNSDLRKYDGQVVKISDWVNNDDNGTRKVSGYIFQKATLQSINGTKITGVKVKSKETTKDDKTTTEYILYYTTVDDPGESTPDANWTQYTDSVSKSGANNADIYLIFKSTAQSVNVHFVDEDGNILASPIYHYANETYEKYPDGFDIKLNNEAQNPWVESIENYTFTGRVHMGEVGWQGFAFSRVKAIKNGDNFHYQYSLDENKPADASDYDWTDLTATDVYLIYKKTMPSELPSTAVEIRYVDADGKPMKDEAGNSLDRVVDASTWTKNQWQNLQAYSESVNGYSINDMAIIQTQNGDSDYTKQSGSKSGLGLENDERIKGVSIERGRAFRYLRYTGSVFQAGNGNQIDVDGGGGKIDKNNKTVPDSKINRYWNISGRFEIYLVYKPTEEGKTYTYTIHYVDEDGNDIPGNNADTVSFTDDKYIKGDKFTVMLSGSGEGTGRTTKPSSADTPIAFSRNITKNITGYTAREYGFLGRATEASGGLAFQSITYEKTGDNQWSYQITDANGTGEKRELNLTNLNFYVVYKNNNGGDNTKVQIHFVDTAGNSLIKTKDGKDDVWGSNLQLIQKNYGTWDGADLTDGSKWPGGKQTNDKLPSDYVFVGEYIGPTFNMDPDKLVATTRGDDSGSGKYIQWKHDSTNGWYTSHGDSATQEHATDGSDKTVFPGYITDIYWVYSKKVTVHHVYVAGAADDGNGLKMSKISDDGGSDQTIDPLPNTADDATDLTGTTYAPQKLGNDKYAYAGTRVGPAWPDSLKYSDLGANVKSVYRNNGQLMYYGSTTTSLSYLRRNTWYHAESNGRRFELTQDSEGNYTLNDSRHGVVSLNESGSNTYVATYHGEAQTTEYKVTYTPSASEGGNGIYNLTVSDWTPNNQTDVYEIYVDTSKYSLWIEDDQMYSGYLIANKAVGIPSNGTYAWYKTVTNSAGETTTSQVLRKQTGIHYNVEYDPKAQTWLDVEADEGGLNSTTQTAVSYYVTYTYTDESGQHTLQSQPLSIEYYSELKNGSFETPNYGPNGDIGKDGKPINQVTNSAYRNTNDKNGVWQSTGTGTEDQSNPNVNIEIVNTAVTTNGTPSFKSSYKWNGDAPYAKEGSQFAELNCSAAGALYQDVVTHPNEQLHYWFSHRARGQNQNSTPEYDTMYLVIMPTKLAMTSGSDGGELKTQSDLIDFINAHGGFDYNLATSVSQEITHSEDDDGILIMKVSSNDQFWHTVRSLNGYIAKAGLTRFFFAAGPTSWSGENGSRAGVEKATHGNFLDDVGFSQDPPRTDGFNLSVTKTFTGLSDDQLKGLAEQVTDSEGNVTKQEKPFTISISDKFASENDGLTDNNALVALNGAKLGFNVSGSEGNYTYTPVATIKRGGTDVSILSGNSSGTVTKNQDGSITMTWDFLDQSLVDKAGNMAGNSTRFYYTVKEENTGVSGMYLTSTETHSNTSDSGEKTSGNGGSQYIRQGDSAAFTFSNEYKNSSASEQPQMIVTKTFSGMTPQAVAALLPNYSLKLQKGSDSEDTVTLVADSANPVKSEEGVKDAVTEGQITNVTVTQTKNDDSSTTLKWLIKGWGADSNYTITEEGYDTTAYPLASVSVNGDTSGITDTNRETTVTTTNDNGEPTTSEVDVKRKQKTGVAVGNASTIQVDSTKTKKQGSSDSSITTVEDANKPTADTNLIAAQYTLKNGSGDEKRYFVWTTDTLGANTSQAICDGINKQFNITTDADKATIQNTDFRSSPNPGTVSVGSGGAGSISYDSQTQTLSFTGSEVLTWNQFFSTRYWVGSDSSKDSGKYTDTDIAVANSYKPVVRIKKVSSDANQTALNGAEFRLFKIVEGERNYYTGDSTEPWSNDTTKAKTYETAGTGDDAGTIIMGELPIGETTITYYLEEVTAPAGYNKLTKPMAFTVGTDGIVKEVSSVTDEKGNPTYGEMTTEDNVDIDNSKAELDWNSPYYTVTVSNSSGFALPETGGPGTIIFSILGLLLLFGGGTWLYFRRKRSKSTFHTLL